MVAHVSKCVCSLYNPDLYRKSSSSQFQLNTPGQRPATTLRLTAIVTPHRRQGTFVC